MRPAIPSRYARGQQLDRSHPPPDADPGPVGDQRGPAARHDWENGGVTTDDEYIGCSTSAGAVRRGWTLMTPPSAGRPSPFRAASGCRGPAVFFTARANLSINDRGDSVRLEPRRSADRWSSAWRQRSTSPTAACRMLQPFSYRLKPRPVEPAVPECRPRNRPLLPPRVGLVAGMRLVQFLIQPLPSLAPCGSALVVTATDLRDRFSCEPPAPS
jgi:hypothetical protein